MLRLCRWYCPRLGGSVNCFLISDDEYLLILSAKARRSALGSVAMARARLHDLGARGEAGGRDPNAQPLQRPARRSPASSVSRAEETSVFPPWPRSSRGRALHRRPRRRRAWHAPSARRGRGRHAEPRSGCLESPAAGARFPPLTRGRRARAVA